MISKWNGQNSFGRDVSSGVYFYRVAAGPVEGARDFVGSKKMILVR